MCRDFAHLGIAFCRALGTPARFVTAYAYKLEPADFHACFEAYLGGRWYVFDATRHAPPTGFVRIGVGRDAADTSFATIYGLAEMRRCGSSSSRSRAPTPNGTTPRVHDLRGSALMKGERRKG